MDAESSICQLLDGTSCALKKGMREHWGKPRRGTGSCTFLLVSLAISMGLLLVAVRVAGRHAEPERGVPVPLTFSDRAPASKIYRDAYAGAGVVTVAVAKVRGQHGSKSWSQVLRIEHRKPELSYGGLRAGAGGEGHGAQVRPGGEWEQCPHL
jgi:hypothetical protein